MNLKNNFPALTALKCDSNLNSLLLDGTTEIQYALHLPSFDISGSQGLTAEEKKKAEEKISELHPDS